MPKILLGTLPRSRKFPVAKTLYGCEGGYHVFPWKKLSITVPQSFIGNASWFEKVSGTWRNKWTRRGVSQSSVKTLVSCYRKYFWELFGVSKKFWQRKICMDGSGGHLVFPWNYFESQYRRNSLGNLRGFRNLLVWQKHINKTGAMQISVKHFLFPFTEKVHWQLFVVSENFSLRKYLGTRQGLSRFPVEFFRLIIPKNFIGSSSVFQENSGSEKFVWMWAGLSRFPVDFVSTHNTENFHWELFSVSRKMSERKVCMDERRGYHVFPSKFFESQYRRNSLGNLRRFRNFLLWEEKYEKDGG